jgi:hypothetical protein
MQTDPRDGEPESSRTTIRVLAGAKALVIGIECEQPSDVPVVSFSVRRDATLTQEDYVGVVLGPFMDGRSGYVFAVNQSGARYDGIINPGGESEMQVDSIFSTAAATPRQWVIQIGSISASFVPICQHFNVQRRVQGLRPPLGLGRAAYQ